VFVNGFKATGWAATHLAMKKGKAPFWVWIAVVAVFAFLIVQFVLWDRQRLTPERMESIIAADMPPGVARREVERWAIQVAARSPHRTCVCISGGRGKTLPAAVVKQVGSRDINEQAIESALILSVPAARLNWRASEDMFVYFFFDREHRLLTHHIALRRFDY
jgi:hypothetical protein